MTLVFRINLILPIILASASFCLASLDVTYEWKYVDYVWKSDEAKSAAIESGSYDYTKIIIHDVQPLSDGRVVVTTPKYFDNPASLSVISDESGDGGPLLEPYPSWSWHTGHGCSRIISVSRVIVDDYDRLWLVDAGKIGNEQVCSAKLLVFDTTTDDLLHAFEIPNHLAHNPEDKSQGRLEILTVQTSKNLYENTWVYISDTEGFGILITNLSIIWRRNDEVFKPNLDDAIFSIVGVNFTLIKGISGDVIPEGYLNEPTLLFKSTTAVRGHTVSLKDLQHSSSPKSALPAWTMDFTEPSQETARTFTKDGILVAAFPTETTIGCWNAENPLLADYIGFLDTNQTIYQFVSSIKYAEDIVWLISNRLQNFITGIMNFGEINFRIITGNVTTLTAGTVCESSKNVTVTTIEEKAFHRYNGTS